MIVISKHMAINMDYVIHWTAGRTAGNNQGTTLTFRDNKSVYLTVSFDVFNTQYRMAKDDGLNVFWLEY